MRRKVIQLAGKTLVVSLPSKWAKKCGVKKGGEMDVQEEEKRLILTVDSKLKKSPKLLDAKGMEVVLGRVIGGMYKAGYDDIEITYDSPEQYAIISKTLSKTCSGYEIIKHDRRTLKIKNIAELHEEDFDNIMRRLFLTLLSSADDALQYISEGNLNGLEEIELRDVMINKYSDLCRRLLNLKSRETTTKTTTHYYICEELEKVGDGYKDLASFIINNKIKKVDKPTISLLAELNRLLRLFYELFYQFNFVKLEEFGVLSEKLKKQLSERLDSASAKELKLNYHLFRIFSLLFDMNGSLITANV